MKIKVIIYEILRITAGRFHCWCESNVGVIRKENKNVSDDLWDIFLPKPLEVKELKWYQKLWNWFIKLLKNK